MSFSLQAGHPRWQWLACNQPGFILRVHNLFGSQRLQHLRGKTIVCQCSLHDQNWLVWHCSCVELWLFRGLMHCILLSSSPQVAVLDSLSPNQKAELILDPSTGALENETLVKNVFISLLDSPREEQLNEFFVTFVEVTKQVSTSLSGWNGPCTVRPGSRQSHLTKQSGWMDVLLSHEPFIFQENITIITNTAVRDTMLDLTLMALAPKFDVFEPKDFQLWFQVNLVVLLASFHPGRLVDIPLNITCESYNAM